MRGCRASSLAIVKKFGLLRGKASCNDKNSIYILHLVLSGAVVFPGCWPVLCSGDLSWLCRTLAVNGPGQSCTMASQQHSGSGLKKETFWGFDGTEQPTHKMRGFSLKGKASGESGDKSRNHEHPDGRGTRLSTKLCLAPRAENRIAKGKLVNLVRF